MAAIRFVMVGGFLGAGKTTAVSRLAQMYQSVGRRVAVVTNDQAADLVDTARLRAEGLPVGEVAGACFCCNFNELTDVMAGLRDSERPDVILAEPVGSCTDLVATVIQPIKALFGATFAVAPYAVIVKPGHGLRILRGTGGGFSPSAAYIFDKQLEEADLLLINRVDELSREEVDELATRLKERQPDTPVMRVSAKTGEGFDALFAFLAQEGDFGRRILDLDYDVYAAGEAELGWLNGAASLAAAEPVPLDEVLTAVVGHAAHALEAAGAEVAHLKVIGLHEGFYGVANLTHRGGAAELSLPSRCSVTEADVTVNARVAIDPEELEVVVRNALEATARRFAAQGLRLTLRQAQRFRPARPVPTHRYAEAVD